VVDTYQFPAFEAGSVLRVGLYSPVDGTRLNILDQKHNFAGDYLEIQTKVP
jgi:hypothetical protein